MTSFSKGNFLLFCVLFLTLIGGVLRFYNINWDRGYNFHPDERNIDAAVSRISFFDSMDPEFFAYGGLPVYLYRSTAEIMSSYTNDPSWLHDWGKINIIGRSFSALFSTLTIIAIYKLGSKLFDRKVGVLAAAFATFSPGLIQLAHFGITENFLTLMVTLICIYSLKFLDEAKIKNYAISGSLLGIALAAKTSAVSFAVIPFTSIVLATFTRPLKIRNFYKSIFLGLLFLVAGILFFLLLSPYTLLSWSKFVESMRYESGVVSGRLLVPYVLQFINTTPYAYQIKNLLWQIGPVVVASIVGFFLLFSKLVKTRRKNLVVFLVFPVIYFLYVGSWHTKFIRYMLPMIPFLVIFASFVLFWVNRKSKRVGEILIVFFVATSVLWGVAFFSIYTKPQTRISASLWIYENIEPGSTILGEHWDDGLPVHLSEIQNTNNYAYDIDQLTIYDADSRQKISYFSDELSRADYLILSSRRLYGTLINLTNHYPITSRYYKLLFSEELGYEKVGEFASYPSIFRLQINDDSSEETFQVYDHPKVIIFKNTQKLDRAEIERRLML